MKTLLQLLQKYPISVLCYVLYAVVGVDQVITNLQFSESIKHLQPDEISSAALSAASAGLESVWFVVVSLVFFIISVLNGVFRKLDRRFYNWLCILIFIELILVLSF